MPQGHSRVTAMLPYRPGAPPSRRPLSGLLSDEKAATAIGFLKGRSSIRARGATAVSHDTQNPRSPTESIAAIRPTNIRHSMEQLQPELLWARSAGERRVELSATQDLLRGLRQLQQTATDQLKYPSGTELDVGRCNGK